MSSLFVKYSKYRHQTNSKGKDGDKERPNNGHDVPEDTLDAEQNRAKLVVDLEMEDDFEKCHACCHTIDVGSNVNGVSNWQQFSPVHYEGPCHILQQGVSVVLEANRNHEQEGSDNIKGYSELVQGDPSQ